ncbi:hypothetical protein, partial [Escherichia coli]|uniref:hypothetical protein n=1 Tax=Escherichia coli TaxID=562 RepID=UPI001EE0253D
MTTASQSDIFSPLIGSNGHYTLKADWLEGEFIARRKTGAAAPVEALQHDAAEQEAEYHGEDHA